MINVLRVSYTLQTISHETFLKRSICIKIQSIEDFKTRYVLKIRYISISKESFHLLLNSRIALLTFNYFEKQCWRLKHTGPFTRAKKFVFCILGPLSKNMGNMHSSLSNAISHLFTCEWYSIRSNIFQLQSKRKFFFG